jgi:hypothetical protein
MLSYRNLPFCTYRDIPPKCPLRSAVETSGSVNQKCQGPWWSLRADAVTKGLLQTLCKLDASGILSTWYKHVHTCLNQEMSRAERAGRAKKMNNSHSHCPALRLRRRREAAAPSCEAASWLHWKGKVWSIVCFSLYSASRVSGRSLEGLGKHKLLLHVCTIFRCYSMYHT